MPKKSPSKKSKSPAKSSKTKTSSLIFLRKILLTTVALLLILFIGLMFANPTFFSAYLLRGAKKTSKVKVIPDPTLITCLDRDGDGYGTCPTDCDDTNPEVNPGRGEALYGILCSDGLDNDCDGLIDDADPGCEQECQDLDGDGFGDPASVYCTYDARDCDDTDPDINPLNEEDEFVECNDGLDNDCDRLPDEYDPDCAGLYIECSQYGEDCEACVSNGCIFCANTQGQFPEIPCRDNLFMVCPIPEYLPIDDVLECPSGEFSQPPEI